MKNKLYKFGFVGAVLIMATACNPDKDPMMNTDEEFSFVLNTPPMANQVLDLSAGGNLTLSVSQPDYGLTLAPIYGVQVSLKEDFTAIKTQTDPEAEPIPDYVSITPESQIKAVLEVKNATIAEAINQLNGIFSEEDYKEDYQGPLYIRATATLGAGLAAEKTFTLSNVITMKQVLGYASFESEEAVLYMPGGANGWSNDIPYMYYYEETAAGAQNYRGFAKLDGDFKITLGSWDSPGNFGMGDEGLVEQENGSYTATFVENGGNFTAPAAGLYYVDVVLTNWTSTTDGTECGTVTLTPITSVAICGAFTNNWDLASVYPLTDNGSYTIWTYDGSVTDEGWKFVFNGSWDINLGGDPEKLTFNSDDNLFLGGSSVTLDLTQYPWTVTVE